jgi:hypothetical protein
MSSPDRGCSSATVTRACRVAEASHSTIRNPQFKQACHSVSERAARTLKWAEEFAGVALLDFALNRLTLGRAALYQAILEGGTGFQPVSAHGHGTARTPGPPVL